MKKITLFLVLMCLVTVGCDVYPTSKFYYNDCIKVIDGFYKGLDGRVIKRLTNATLSVTVWDNAAARWINIDIFASDVQKCAEQK